MSEAKRRRAHNAIDITSQRFGRLTAIESIPGTRSGPRLWRCRCDCGNKTTARSVDLRTGKHQSCGCLKLEKFTARVTRHGQARVQKRSDEYIAWKAMKQRCYDDRSKNYPYYGGRGITVCERWRDIFEVFFEDMGRKPSPDHTLERVDNDRGYEPGNCRWATRAEQSVNRRNTIYATYDGRTLPIAEWARIVGVKTQALLQRIRSGWPDERALTEPFQVHRKRSA